MENQMLVEYFKCMKCGKQFIIGNLGTDEENNDGVNIRCIKCGSKDIDFAPKRDKYKLIDAYEYATK